MTFHAQLPPLPSQLTVHDERRVLWIVVFLLLVLVLLIWLRVPLKVTEALTTFGVVVAEVKAGLDVAVTSANNLDAIVALLIAARDDAVIDDAAATGTPAFGFTTPFAQHMLI